jgi:hypothetical protein
MKTINKKNLYFFLFLFERAEVEVIMLILKSNTILNLSRRKKQHGIIESIS